ncbi:MAG: hypothetical protein QGI86_11990 [Candidatus Poribacteria bacterium]|nr:hypothetical protein [Candidatus Poribacteria bacterium]MDP6750021.1 hypothetical protein [Candidatus Poribacteria bacterium]
MKIRCMHNSLRLRLQKSDLTILQKTNNVSENIIFGPNQVLTYQLQMADSLDHPEAQYQQNTITVRVPTPIVETWVDTTQVSIQAHLPLSANNTEGTNQLHLLIEKDFPCQHQEESGFADTFFELVNDEDNE